MSTFMYVFNRNVTDNRAKSIAAFKHFRNTVQFMYSAADSATGCSTTGSTEGEAYNGTGSSHSPYIYNSHRIQRTQILMTCLELSADSVMCCFVITYCSAEWNRKLCANCQYTV